VEDDVTGCFFVLEGPDAVGKTTAARAIIRALRRRGRKVIYTHEPTRSRFGRAAKRLAEQGADLSELLELFAADRTLHIEQLILPAIQRGAIVIADRYKYSTFVYQGLRRFRNSQLMIAADGLAPGRTFLLDCDAQTIKDRLHKRGDDSHERVVDLQRVIERYRSVPAAYPSERFSTVDAKMTKGAVSANILHAIFDELDGPNSS
jgi:dTMP kinase